MSSNTASRWFANAALLVVSLIVTAGMLDVALRFIYPPPIKWTFPQEYYDFDAEIAHALRPNQDAYTHDKPVSINSLGLRDVEYAAIPAPGTWRILGMGDSQTFGNGVSSEDTWPKQLESQLNEQRSELGKWEVLNAGIPGTDTWQHEIWMSRLLDAYHPHAVVLAFYVNDVSPSYEPKPKNTEAKTNTTRKRIGYLVKRSALLNIVQQRMAALEHSRRLEKGRASSEFIVSGEPNERIDRGWAQVEKSLSAMQATCDERGIEFLLAVLPRRDQVAGDLEKSAYNERIAAIAGRHGIPLVDLLPELSEAYEARGAELFIPWDGHNSAVANRVIAKRIRESLENVAFAPRRRSKDAFALK